MSEVDRRGRVESFLMKAMEKCLEDEKGLKERISAAVVLAEYYGMIKKGRYGSEFQGQIVFSGEEKLED